MSEKILIEKTGHVVTLTLNMPETRNALSDPDFCAALMQHVAALNRDLSVGCIVLTGTGDVFCSGGNIKHIRGRAGIFGGDALQVRDNYRASVQALARSVWEPSLRRRV